MSLSVTDALTDFVKALFVEFGDILFFLLVGVTVALAVCVNISRMDPPGELPLTDIGLMPLKRNSESMYEKE
jgi:hypothetical protein